jgi:hypothetical protein
MGAQDQTSWWTPPVHMRRRGRAKALCVLAAVAAGTTACAQEADPADVAVGEVEYEATPAYLTASAERSQAQPYRMEMRESLAGGDEVVVETGEWDGQRLYLRNDLGAPLGEVLPGGADVDFSIETAGDRSTLYLRMPEALTAGVMIVPFGDLVGDLDGGWGRVDLDELADLLPGDQGTTSAIGTYDPRLFVDVVTKSTDVEELGDAEIRGVPVRGLAAEVPYADLLAVQGFTPASIEAINDITVPVEVWVDRAGLVRRVSFEFRLDEIAAAPGQALSSHRPEVAVTVDLFDYGDESIRVELPADAIDITDAFRGMLESSTALRGE